MFIRKSRHFSLSGRVYRLFAVTYILFFCILLTAGIYMYRKLSRHTTESYTAAAGYFTAQLDESLSNVCTFLFSTVSASSEIGTLPESSNDLALAASRMQARLAESAPSFLSKGGAFLYVPSTDTFISNSIYGSDLMNAYFRSELRACQADASLEKYIEAFRKYWHLIFWNESWYAVRILNYNGIISGAWFSLSSLTEDFYDAMLSDKIVLFVSPDDPSEFCSDNAVSGLSYDEQGSVYLLTEEAHTLRYIPITADSASFREHFVILISQSSVNTALLPFYTACIAIFAVYLISALMIGASIRRNLSEPSREFREITASLRAKAISGNVPADIPEFHSSCAEIQDIYEALGPFLREMSSLQDRFYKAQLAKNEFELQSLKNQVAPHFLINCLSTVSSLSNSPENQPLMKNLISLLAAHLRYTLSSGSSVSISAELSHLKGYYELMQIRYPDSLLYQLDIGGLSEDAAIFPGLLIMLSENSIKHNLAVGEELTIHVIIREEERERENCIHIIHMDSGEGFDEDTLTRLRHLDTPGTWEQTGGYHIGLYNIVKRLKLMYGDARGSVTFSNEPGSGARIDILIPFIPYQES